MFITLLKLTILFFVIFDPILSFGVFAAATKKMDKQERRKVALLAVGLAMFLSFTFIIFGERVLSIFSTSLDNFRVAGGIVLGILGLDMVLGTSAKNIERTTKSSWTAIAAIIATPLLTGPAAITAILISVNDFGILYTALPVAIVLTLTGILFLLVEKISKLLHPVIIQIISTILGLVTLSWSVEFIRKGLGF